MKIGVLNNLYEPFKKGGAEKIAAALILEAQAAGHDVFLITTKPPQAPTPPPGALKIYYLDSRYYNLGAHSFLYRFGWQLNNLFSFKKSRAIRKILKREKPDLVITHNLMGLGFMTPRAIHDLQIKHEHFLHDIQLLHPSGLMFYGDEKKIASFFARLYQSLTRTFFASPSKIISPSRWLLDEHTKRGFFPHSISEVRPYEQTDENIPPVASNAKHQAQTFLYAGQMVAAKGIFLLIDAFKKLNQPNAKMMLVGNGVDLERAKQLADSDQRLEFFPWSEETETAKLNVCDYLIVPSLCYENSPTIIAKAHGLGRKVIASRLGGIPEIIKPNDILFTPGSSQELLKILEKLTERKLTGVDNS